MKNVVTKTNGKKTESVGLLMIAFQVFLIFYPNTLSQNEIAAINVVISSGALAALGHRLWRNKKKYWNSIVNLFTKNDKEQN